jgi:hypothetical protein
MSDWRVYYTESTRGASPVTASSNLAGSDLLPLGPICQRRCSKSRSRDLKNKARTTMEAPTQTKNSSAN